MMDISFAAILLPISLVNLYTLLFCYNVRMKDLEATNSSATKDGALIDFECVLQREHLSCIASKSSNTSTLVPYPKNKKALPLCHGIFRKNPGNFYVDYLYSV